MLSPLKEKHGEVIALYSRHREAVLGLRKVLHDKVIGTLDLSKEDEGAALEWCSDIGSIFRMLKKHKFDPELAHGALERTLRWRTANLVAAAAITNYRSESDAVNPSGSLPMAQSSSAEGKFIYALSPGTLDVLGRPVAVLQASNLEDTEQAKKGIIRVYEQMRKRLRHGCAHNLGDTGLCENDDPPSLQFVIIIDCKGISMRYTSMAVDLISWFIKEATPHFPGMCAALFVLNYSWGYGMYNIIKRLLPASVLSRIHFPKQTELLECFDKASLPKEFGGDLDTSTSDPPSSSDLALETHPGDEDNNENQAASSIERSASNSSISSHLLLPAMSALNPYFGYPVISSPGSSVPYLRNGRRRKRDLARTLFRLWLMKMKRWGNKTSVWILMSIILWAVGL